jgi:hypothetical protein
MRFTNKFKATSLIAIALILGACSGGELPSSTSNSISSSSGSGNSSTITSSASSSSINYIPITNAEELRNIRNNLFGNYRLMNNIDLESVEWQPIGTANTPFSGTLDGKEFTISNLNITQTQEYVGLFASNNGTITNLNLSNVAVSMIGAIDKTLYVGSLIGFNSGRVSNIKTIGGQIDIRVRGSQPCYLGGVIGWQNKSNISNILNSINVTGNGTTHTGGVIGYNYIDFSSRIITLDNVINFGNIESNKITVGGLVGYQNSGDLVINDSINAGIIKGLDFVGGLVGGNSYTTNAVLINNSSNLAFIDGTTGGAVGGLVAYALNVEINNSFNNGQVIGKGTCTTFYICGSGGLIGVANRANITNSYNLGDINSRVTGGLIGLTDLFIITSSANFGDINGSNGVGGLVGESNYSSGSSNLIKSSNYGLVKGARKSGGLIGYSYVSIDISESMNIGDVTGTSEVGGLIGYAKGENTGITNSANYANVSGTGDEIGGFIGSGDFTNISILKSLNFGQIRGENELGGFIGLNYVYQETLFVDNSAQFGSIFSTLTNPSGGFNVGDIAGDSKNNDFLKTYFYGNLYSNQNSITGKRLAIAIQDLNIINLAFFTSTLNFNNSIWNFADLNLASGYPPTLKNLPTVEEIIELLESTTSTINDLILIIEEINYSNS